MDIIKTGFGIGKTIRNVSRLREILNSFAANGFDEFIIKTNLHQKIPGFVLPKARIEKALSEVSGESEADWWKVLGYRLRKSFEVLGPSFIKLGQLLSTREDLFGAGFIEEMKILQNQAPKPDFKEIKPIIERNIKSSIEDYFKEFDENPIGIASIGVVYKAVLNNGQKVVVKVRKPGMKRIIETDFEIINFIVGQVEKVSEEIRYLGLSRMLDDFEKTIKLELNFNVEALNCNKLKENIEAIDKEKILSLPHIYKELSSEELLIMEFMQGTPFNKLTPSDLNDTLSENMIKSVHMFLHTLLADGFFHADLHGGNFFLLEDNKIGIIDFGLMGVLSKKNRDNLVAILYALGTNNYENLVYELLDVADYDIIPNEGELIRDLKEALRPYIGLTVQETNVTDLVHSIINTLSKHQIYLPREWFIIFRALMTLDGVGKSVGIDLDIFSIIDKDINNIMKELLSKEAITEDLLWVGRDIVNSVRVIPRHIRWFLKESAKDGYALELKVKNLEEYSNQLNKGIYFSGLTFMSGVFVCLGTVFVYSLEQITLESIPIITWIFWSLAAFFFARANFTFRIR